MAKVSGPSDLAMDFISIGDGANTLDIFFPVDLPEGGQLQIVTGPSPLQPANLRVDIPPGAMVAMLDAENTNRLVPSLAGVKLPENASAAALEQPLYPYGLPLLRPLWFPSGGFLNVRVGLDVNAQPQPSTPIAAGSLLAIVPPEPAELFRTRFKLAAGQNPYAVIPNGVHR